MPRTFLLVALLLAPVALVACDSATSEDAPADASSPNARAEAGPDASDASPGHDATAECPAPLPCVPDVSCYDGCNSWMCGADGGFFSVTTLACPSQGDAGATD